MIVFNCPAVEHLTADHVRTSFEEILEPLDDLQRQGAIQCVVDPLTNVVDSDAFYGLQTYRIHIIDLGNLKTIPRDTFRDFDRLTTVIAREVTIIERNAFRACLRLTSFHAPNLTRIENAAFFACGAFLSSEFLRKVMFIEANAFHDAPFHDDVVIDVVGKRISTSAFENSACYLLNIGSNTSIGDYAFWGSAIYTVIIDQMTDPLGAQTFGSSNIRLLLCPSQFNHKQLGGFIQRVRRPIEWAQQINDEYRLHEFQGPELQSLISTMRCFEVTQLPRLVAMTFNGITSVALKRHILMHDMLERNGYRDRLMAFYASHLRSHRQRGVPALPEEITNMATLTLTDMTRR